MSASASSLPTTTNAAATASSSKSRRRSVYIAVVALLIFGAVLGITLGVTLGGNNKNGNTNTSLTASAAEASDNGNEENQDDNESPSAAVDDTASPAPEPTPSLTSDSDGDSEGDSDNMTLEPSPSPESSESASTAAAETETLPPTSSDPPASSGSAALTTAPTAGPTTGPTTAPSISSLPTPSPTTPEPTPTPSPTTQEPTVQEPQDEEFGEIVLDTIAIANGKIDVDYYRCHTTTIPNRQGDFRNVSIVLLHGGSFSKEDWLKAGILEELCANARTVIALDLSTSANREELKDVLTELSETSSPTANNNKNDDNKLLNLPIDFLVTPSASGYAIVDWMMNGNVTEMADYFRTWVPVATGSLTMASDDEILALSNVPGLDILAINGNEDTAGGRYSNRLGDLAGATVVELEGRHAVYLQSSKDFAQTILDYLYNSPA